MNVGVKANHLKTILLLFFMSSRTFSQFQDSMSHWFW